MPEGDWVYLDIKGKKSQIYLRVIVRVFQSGMGTEELLSVAEKIIDAMKHKQSIVLLTGPESSELQYVSGEVLGTYIRSDEDRQKRDEEELYEGEDEDEGVEAVDPFEEEAPPRSNYTERENYPGEFSSKVETKEEAEERKRKTALVKKR